MANFETAFWDSPLSDTLSFETWSSAGSEDAATRANRIWKQNLADYEAPPIDGAADEALRDFVKRKKASMEDAWY